MSGRSRWDEVVLFVATILLVIAAALMLFAIVAAVTGKLQAAPLCPPPDPGVRPVVRLAAGEISQLARLAWAENRSSGYCGMLSIASVVINRMQEDPKTFGATITQVINKPYQFSVFGKTDHNRRKMAKVSEDDDEFVSALLAAIAAVSGVDNSHRALYFYSGSPPYWAAGMVVTTKMYGHVFLRPRS
jgi:spore germination cell wall hydrolase CwlJ-like protein